MTTHVKQAILIFRTLIIILVLLTNLTRGFLIKTIHTDIEQPEQKATDNQRQTLLELLQTLQALAEDEKQREQRNELPIVRGSEIDGTQLSSIDKRDYGIMPPWNEMCRLMRVAFCVRNRKR